MMSSLTYCSKTFNFPTVTLTMKKFVSPFGNLYIHQSFGFIYCIDRSLLQFVLTED